MGKRNLVVKEDYEYFHDLCFGEKICNSETIVLDVKDNNKDWLVGNDELEHVSTCNKIKLIVERKLSLFKYGIKLHRPEFIEKPYFRFDSDGPAHRNISEALTDQMVTTPHFNTFNEEGEEYAYKSEILKKDKESNAIMNDLSFGIAHFFQEANIKTNDPEKYPEVRKKNEELFEIEHRIDPLRGINFLE